MGDEEGEGEEGLCSNFIFLAFFFFLNSSLRDRDEKLEMRPAA